MPGDASPGSDAARDAVITSARTHAPDLYAAALLAPAEARSDLIVLAAYLGEVRRIPLVVRDVTLALIRLQWWRDVLTAPVEGGRTGHPVADAFLDVMKRRSVPMALATSPLDASEAELATDPLDEPAFRAYLDDAGGAVIRMAAHVLGHTESGPAGAYLDAAGHAIAAAGLAASLPFHIRSGRLPAAASMLSGLTDFRSSEAASRTAVAAVTDALIGRAEKDYASVRRLAADAPRAARAAALPVALVPHYVKAVQRPGRDCLRDVPEISPLRRMWFLWLAHIGGSV